MATYTAATRHAHTTNARRWYAFYRKAMGCSALRSMIGAIRNRDMESAFADLM